MKALLIVLLLAGVVSFTAGCIAMAHHDWIQACAWFLMDIACTQASKSARSSA